MFEITDRSAELEYRRTRLTEAFRGGASRGTAIPRRSWRHLTSRVRDRRN
jgi:hypothetical protein